MKNNKKVSVAIVTYNNEDIIEKTVSSIINHTARIDFDLHFYVIDNNSRDDTVKIITNKFPLLKLIKLPKNIGFGAAHNKVVNLLNSEYHAVINPDIRFKDDIISGLYSFMEVNPDIVLTVPKFLNEDGTEQFTPKLQPDLKYMLSGRFASKSKYFGKLREEYTFKSKKVTEPVDVGFCSGCFLFIKTSVFKKIGGFDERYFLYSEDADLTRTAKKYGRTVYNPNVSVIHLWERGYLKSRKLFFIQIKSMLKYLWKWRGQS